MTDAEPPSDPESVARAICLKALAQRARTRAELAALLRRRGVPEQAATAVLDRFTEVGLIDDATLAQTVAQAAQRERGLSSRAVAVTLRRRGVADVDVEHAVAEIGPDDERVAARALIERKLRSLRGLDAQTQGRRLVAQLARRGYSPGLAYSVVREVLTGADLPEVFDGDEAPNLGAVTD